MRDRKETVPPEQAREVARIVKEQVRIIPLLHTDFYFYFEI